MKLGVSLRSGYVIDDARRGAGWMVERARASWLAGLDSLFVGDHHAVPVPYYQNSPMLGRLLAEWGDRPAGALYLLPLSGLFMSVIYPTLNSKGISCVPKKDHGAAAGVILFFTCVSAVFAPLAMGAAGDAMGHIVAAGLTADSDGGSQ